MYLSPAFSTGLAVDNWKIRTLLFAYSRNQFFLPFLLQPFWNPCHEWVIKGKQDTGPSRYVKNKIKSGRFLSTHWRQKRAYSGPEGLPWVTGNKGWSLVWGLLLYLSLRIFLYFRENVLEVTTRRQRLRMPIHQKVSINLFLKIKWRSFSELGKKWSLHFIPYLETVP